MTDYTLPPIWAGFSENMQFELKEYGQQCAEAARAPLLARIAELERALAERSAGVEPVAEVMPGYALAWAGSEPLAELLRRHPSVGVGTKLYAAQPAQTVALRCRDCGKPLQFDAGDPPSRNHPGQRECWFCADCGTEHDPYGWVAVPREPTEEMRRAGVHALKGAADEQEWRQIESAWAVMIARKPEVPRG